MVATINSLMKHLRSSGIQIHGPAQKRKLRKIGYYHGYKGYRFAKRSSNRLPLSDFNEIAGLYDFDMQIKSLLYQRIMEVETALKNRVLEAVLEHSGSDRFDVIYRKSLTGYKRYDRAGGQEARKAYKAAWNKRLQLRTEIDRLIVLNHENKPVIKHFRDRDREIPIWALFEIMTLGNFTVFYSCLDKSVQLSVCRSLGMPGVNFDSTALLSKMLFAFKDLRNAVAHNGVVLDVRFKTGGVAKSVGSLLSFETSVANIEFDDLTDYIVLLVYLMARLGFTKTECRQLLQDYQGTLEKYRKALPYNIYSQFLGSRTHSKLEAVQQFVSNS